MKNIFLIIITIISITACKKSPSNPQPVTLPPLVVNYAFAANKNDTYTIKFTDSDKAVSTEIITGNSWSKSMKIAAAVNPGKLTLYVESSNKSFDASGNISVMVSGQMPASMPLISASDTYGLRGQITYYISNP